MKWILFFILCSAVPVMAQEETPTEAATPGESVTSVDTPAPIATTKAPAKKSFYREDTAIGMSYMQWNEKLKLQQGMVSAEDKANYEGAVFSAERNFGFASWGFVFGGMLGSGKASGGTGNGAVTFQKGNQPWTMYGAYAKVYQKWTGRLYGGIAVPIFFKQMSWPEQNGIQVTSGKNLNLGALFELNLRLTPKWDFYQSIGPLNEDGSTLWKLGLSYRL